MILGLDVPPISHLVRWENLFGTDGPFGINKVVLLTWLAVIIVLVFFFSARKRQLVPSGTQNFAEAIVDMKNGITIRAVTGIWIAGMISKMLQTKMNENSVSKKGVQ